MSRGTVPSERSAARPCTFVDLLLSGDALQHDVDDFIDTWHEAEPGSPEAAMGLPDFLGMTPDEYRLWTEQPASLQFIVYARKMQQPVATVIQTYSRAGIAARAADQSEARKLLQWLRETGRIEEDR